MIFHQSFPFAKAVATAINWVGYWGEVVGGPGMDPHQGGTWEWMDAFKDLYTLPETNSLPLKMDGRKTSFLLGWPIFRCYVSFREGNISTGVIKWDLFWGNQTMQMHGKFEAFPLIFVHCLGWYYRFQVSKLEGSENLYQLYEYGLCKGVFPTSK